MITIQKYVRAQSLEEAYQLNQNKRNRIVGGMMWLRLGSGGVGTAIDLCDLGLDTIEETATQFSIGAMVPLRQLELHAGLNAYTGGAVKNAVKDIVGVQFRNMATVGGSIWGRFGFSDVLTMFLTMDCFVELYKGGLVPLEQFAGMKKDNDILVRLIVKKTPGKFIYTAMRNQRTDFPVIACALSQMDGTYRAVIGAAAFQGHGHPGRKRPSGPGHYGKQRQSLCRIRGKHRAYRQQYPGQRCLPYPPDPGTDRARRAGIGRNVTWTSS